MGPFEVFLVWGRFVDGSKWLRSNLSTTPYDLTPTGQRGKLYEKNIFIFDFHILPEHRRIGEKFFPCRCISIKKRRSAMSRSRRTADRVILHK